MISLKVIKTFLFVVLLFAFALFTRRSSQSTDEHLFVRPSTSDFSSVSCTFWVFACLRTQAHSLGHTGSFKSANDLNACVCRLHPGFTSIAEDVALLKISPRIQRQHCLARKTPFMFLFYFLGHYTGIALTGICRYFTGLKSIIPVKIVRHVLPKKTNISSFCLVLKID